MKETSTKAIVAGAVTVVTAFLTALSVALSDGVVDGNEWLTVALAVVGSVGAVAGVTYAAPANRPKE